MYILEQLIVYLAGRDPILLGLAGGIVIALLNLLGASLVLIWRNPSKKGLDAMLGFAGGVMLSASFTSLLLPGVEFATAADYSGMYLGGFELAGIVPVLIGFFLGVLVFDRGERWVHYIGPIISSRFNDKHALSDRGGNSHASDQSGMIEEESGLKIDARVTSVLLFTIAVTLHNMPEGLAVGVGFGSGDIANAVPLMLAIGIQNIPEGLAVSVAAINAGFSRRWYAAVAGARAGLVEIPLALFGASAVVVSAPLLPYAMGFAGGGMLYVLEDEIIPEIHSSGHDRLATLGFMIGAALMLTLDVALG